MVSIQNIIELSKSDYDELIDKLQTLKFVINEENWQEVNQLNSAVMSCEESVSRMTKQLFSIKF